MKLIHHQVTEGESFSELLNQSVSGDHIVLYRGELDLNEGQMFAPHPEGFIVRKHDKVLLNGVKEIYHGKFAKEYCLKPHAQGFIVRIKDGDRILLLLNGKEVLYTSEKELEWFPHPDGFILKEKGKFLLNGKDLLYENNSFLASLLTRDHPKGVLIIDREKKEILLNGNQLLYRYEGDNLPHFTAHPEGIVIQKRDELLLNGSILLYKGEETFANPFMHPKGVLIQKNGVLILNGLQTIYGEGWRAPRSHPNGLLVYAEQKQEVILVVSK